MVIYKILILKIKIMQKKYYLLILVVLLCACKQIFVDEEFTMARTPYLGSELKIDGYYYEKTDLPRIYFFVFYSNGVLLKYSVNDINELELFFNNTPKRIKDNRLWWSPFIINGNELRFEEYNNTIAGKWLVCMVYCTILNDSTFRIEKGILSHTGKNAPNLEYNGEYHFRQYYPKLDSTNNVVP